MKKQRFAIVFIGSLWWASGLAQMGTSSWAIRSMDCIGILRGDAGNYVEFQTINGLYRKSWFLGIGTGLDFYRYRSVPLTVSAVKALTGGGNGLYLGLSGGIGIPWYSRPQTPYSDYTKSQFLAAPCWSADLGYRIKLSAHSGKVLLISAGYSYKEMKEDQSGVQTCPFGAPCPAYSPYTKTRYDYRNQRVSVKAGISL